MSPVLTLLSTMPESDEWLAALTSGGREQEEATERLHALLLRAARFEVGRRRTSLDGAVDVDQLAADAAHDALMKVLAKLDTFRGESRFTTWVYKFALLEAAPKARRRTWREREVALDAAPWPRMPGLQQGPAGQAAALRPIAAARRGI